MSYISRHVSFGCLTKCGAYYTGPDAPEGTLTHSQVGDRIRAAVATLEAAAATREAGRRFRRWSRDPRCQAAASAMQALLRSCPCVARRRECRFRSARALQALARGASVRRQAKLLASSATAVVRRAAIACVRRAAAACALDRAVDAFFGRTGGRAPALAALRQAIADGAVVAVATPACVLLGFKFVRTRSSAIRIARGR